MKKLLFFALILVGCGSENKRPNILDGEGNHTLKIGTNIESSTKDAGSDAARDIEACHNTFDKICIPVCLKMVSKSPERKSCIEHCESEYRVCAGCPDVPTE